MQPVKKHTPTSTVGRGRSHVAVRTPTDIKVSTDRVTVQLGDSLELYAGWDAPKVIVSDGGYGVLGFEGDTSDHLDLPDWYEPHIARWSKYATPETTLWFWNSEIGWAVVHPILERHGWRYVNTNIWNKGIGHIAGNVNTTKIRRFPVVTEVCAQYVFEGRIDGLPLKRWLLREWKRTGLTLRSANEACGVKDVAVRKYLDQGHLWYFPPPGMFDKLQTYANSHGKPEGRPYFSQDGVVPMGAVDWARMRSQFECPHGVTNVWNRPALRGSERIKVSPNVGGNNGRAIHLNQKPIDLLTMIIAASSRVGEVVWEPFGGTFSACVAGSRLGRRCFGGEIDPTYFHHGSRRIIQESSQLLLF